jgi:hypothetical protein
MGFFKKFFNKNNEQSDFEPVTEDIVVQEVQEVRAPEVQLPDPEPTVYLQKLVDGSWFDVEKEEPNGKYRVVTVEHNGVTTIGYKSGD